MITVIPLPWIAMDKDGSWHGSFYGGSPGLYHEDRWSWCYSAQIKVDGFRGSWKKSLHKWDGKKYIHVEGHVYQKKLQDHE